MAEWAEIVGERRRRGQSYEDKLRFVAETCAPGAAVPAVARRHDLSPGLLFTWRRVAEGRSSRAVEPMTMLPVHVAKPAPPKGAPTAGGAVGDRLAGRA